MATAVVPSQNGRTGTIARLSAVRVAGRILYDTRTRTLAVDARDGVAMDVGDAAVLAQYDGIVLGLLRTLRGGFCRSRLSVAVRVDARTGASLGRRCVDCYDRVVGASSRVEVARRQASLIRSKTTRSRR